MLTEVKLELKELLKIHGHENQEHGVLTVDETTIMKGALDMKDKTADVCFIIIILDLKKEDFYAHSYLILFLFSYYYYWLCI